MNKTLLALAVTLATTQSAMAVDFGKSVEKALSDNSQSLFGIDKPLTATAGPASVARKPGQKASDIVKLANGLQASIVSRKSADWSDQMAFWPNDNAPTHIVSCVEDFNNPGDLLVGQYPSGRDKFAPSVQRLNLKTGAVETILRGLSSCDGVRRTPWNTIVVTEERSDGGMYEILNPVASTELTVVARGASDVIDSADQPVTGQVEYRGALGNLGWEGLDMTKAGVVYYGDELRPGTNGADADGGSIYKFIPATPWSGTPVADLSQSPLASGNIYAFQASCVGKTSGKFPQFGQGCEIGQGAWVKVDVSALNATASIQGATGYYRPEDAGFDPFYKGAGVKFCWNNTGDETAQNYGETMCMLDTNPEGTGETTVADDTANGFGLTYLADTAEVKGFAVAAVTRVMEGNPDFSQVDNIAYQPVKGNVYLLEDKPGTPFDDIFACLPDGADKDLKLDGCVKVLSVRDSSSEPTGFMFTDDGKTAYVHIQHSNDSACVDGSDCANQDGYATDDLIKITGFKTGK